MWNRTAGAQVGNLAIADTSGAPADFLESYVEPDVMLPSQFHEIDQEGLLGGERKLMAAILSDGIESYLSDKNDAVREVLRSRGAANPITALKAIHTEAIDWVETRDESYVFSFDNVCRSLGIEPEYLRLGLARYVAAIYSKACNPQQGAVVAWKKIRRPRKR